MTTGRGWLLVAATLLGTTARADEGPYQRSGAWEALFFTVNLGRPESRTGPRLWLDQHFRQRPDYPGQPSDMLFITRPAVGWEFVPGVTAYVGYAWVGTLPAGGSISSEHRPWVQAVLQHRFDRVALQLRPRFELRFLPGQDEIGVRLRTFARVGVDLKGPFGLVVADEPFWALNETASIRPGLDENRFFVGLAIGGQQGMRTEVGYLNRFIPAGPRDAARGKVEHVAAVNLVFPIDARRRVRTEVAEAEAEAEAAE